MVAIPDRYHDLFAKPTFAHLATQDPSGCPHVTPVWIDLSDDGERLLVNTERDRRKERNVQRDPHVGVSMVDPDDPYRRFGAMGRVVDDREAGARAHIDALAQRYMDTEEYPMPIETRRVILAIAPDEVFGGAP